MAYLPVYPWVSDRLGPIQSDTLHALVRCWRWQFVRGIVPCEPTISGIASQTGWDYNQVRQSVRNLERRGAIVKRGGHRGAGGGGCVLVPGCTPDRQRFGLMPVEFDNPRAAVEDLIIALRDHASKTKGKTRLRAQNAASVLELALPALPA